MCYLNQNSEINRKSFFSFSGLRELLVDDTVTLLINDFLPVFLNIPEDILSGTHKPNPFVVGNRIPRSDLPGIVSGTAMST